MKILWISHFLLFPETGYGALQRSRNLLIRLSNFHDIILVCLYRDSDRELVQDIGLAEKDLLQYCNNIYFIPHNVSKINKVLFLLKSIFTKIPYSVYIYRSKLLQEKILRIISENSIDLIHSDTLGMLEPILNEKYSIKTLTHHDVESHKMYRRWENEKNRVKKMFFSHEYRCIYKYEKLYCSQYDLNIVVSDIDRNRLKKISNEIQIEIIENGVDCKYFAYNPRNINHKELIFTGALDYYPNYKGILNFCSETWPILKRKYTDLKFTIIGKNPPRRLEKYVKMMIDVNMIGFVNDVRPYVKNAKVFICPINEGGGTRIKILDAFSQGIPVVSTEVGAEGLDIENGKHILIAKTNEEFIDRISMLLENIELSNAIGQNAREYVEKYYSYEYVGRKLANVYSSLFEKRIII